MMYDVPCLLSVVICTYNRASFLRLLLKSLVTQITEHQSVELLIIDNNSTDETGAIAAEFAQDFPFVRALFCRDQGLSFARNHALNEARGKWIAYIDDDAYTAPDWLSEGLRLIKEDKYDAFGGVYYPWYKDGKKSWFDDSFETNDSWIEVSVEGRLKRGYFSGGNCFFKICKLKAVKGFPTALGMNGKSVGYGEETYTQRLMAINGDTLGFSKRLIIHHYTPLDKQSIWWSCQRHVKYGQSFWIIYQKPLTYRMLYTLCKQEIVSTLQAIIVSKSKHKHIFCHLYVAARFMRLAGFLKGFVLGKLSTLN